MPKNSIGHFLKPAVTNLRFLNQSRPYVVGEINTGHFGDVALALDAVKKAGEAGCSCIKFQSWQPESLYTDRYLLKNRIEARFYQKLSLNEEALARIADYAHECGIGFTSTAYSESEVDFLASLKSVPFLKIASMDITYLHLIRHADRTGLPLVISTGMASKEEIFSAVNAVADPSSVCLLHCTSLYPTPLEFANIDNVLWLIKEFPDCSIGFSDHTLGAVAATGAVALGARLIEKHVTLDKTKPGFDNAMALTFQELENFITTVSQVAVAKGIFERNLSELEIDQRQKLRRSIYTARQILKGEKIDYSMLQLKRPGIGLSVAELDIVIGRTALRTIDSGELIKKSDLVS